MSMNEKLRPAEHATVVLVARERLSNTPRAVRSVVRSLPDDVPIIVVDGAFPDDVRRELDAISEQRPLKILRFERFLLPPEARNLALPLVETPYVAFVDNDIDVRSGWLEALIDGVLAQDAAVGAPVTGLRMDRGEGTRDYVHHAGGDIRLMQYRGRITYASYRRLEWSSVDDPAVAELPRTSDDFECHAFLIRTATLRQLGGFDERLVVCDHDDLALRLHLHGQRIAFCPNAHVCYDVTGSMNAADRDYFAFRWDRGLVDRACDAFEKNWKISQSRAWEWARGHRKRMLAPHAPMPVRLLPQPLFDLYVAYLRARSERRDSTRHRPTAPPVICPDIPPATAECVRDKLWNRQPGSELTAPRPLTEEGVALRPAGPAAS
jgi:glycosyltransferase involved in cell wall biosynthesis